MEKTNSNLLLLMANLVLILIIVIEKIMVVDYFYLNALLVLLLIVSAFMLMFNAMSRMTFDKFISLLFILCFAFISMQQGFNLLFLTLGIASVVLLLMSIITTSTQRTYSLPKPLKPQVVVYDNEPKRMQERKERIERPEKKEVIYNNFYDVDELVKESRELEEAQRYIQEQMRNMEADNEPSEQSNEQSFEGLKIVTKKSAPRKTASKKAKFFASKTGKNFHEANCLAGRKIKSNMKVYFKTKAAASKKYKPCPICLPYKIKSFFLSLRIS
jgi:hypothetical protein